MTTVTHTAPAHPGPQATVRAPRLTFAGVLKSERIKLSSLRSLKITLLITLALGVGLSLLSAWGISSMIGQMGANDVTIRGTGNTLENYLLAVATFASPFLALIFGVLGVFAMSSEYSSGMVLSTFAAVPKRTPVYVAKILVLVAVSVLTALIIVVLGLVGAILFYPDAAESLGSGTVISGAIGAIVYLVCIALLGFGLAALLRSTAGSISVLVGVTFVLPIAFQVLSAFGWEWVPKVLAYLPMPLGSLLAGGIPASGVGPSNGPDFWLGLIAIVIWAALPVAGGLAVLKARDAK